MKYEDYFEGRENRKLFYQYWLPEGEDRPKTYIIAIHGLGTHSDRLNRVAEYLTEKGFAIYAFDLRGHGKNAGETPGHTDSMDHLQKDIVLFMDVVRNDAVDKKIVLMGQSFGGLVSLVYAINHPRLEGLIVLNPLFDLAINENFGKKVIKSILKMKISKEIKLISYIIDQKSLTSDLKILKEYHTDKNALKKISSKTISDANSSLKWVNNNANKLSCPVLLLQAGKDKFVDVGNTKKFFDKIKTENKVYKEYDGLLHDLLNEKSREQIYQDIYVWLARHA